MDVLPEFDKVIENIVSDWKEKKARGDEDADHVLNKIIDLAEIKQQQSIHRMAIVQHKKHGIEGISDSEEEEEEEGEETFMGEFGEDPKEVLQKALKLVPVSAIMIKRKITVLDSKDTPATALEKLARRGVLSAPVVQHNPDKPNVVLGLLDISGVLEWMLSCLKGTKERSVEKQFDTQHVGELIEYMAPWEPVSPETSLFDMLAKFSKGVHRVPVVASDGKFKGIVSQSNAVQFFHKHKDLVAPFTSVLVQDVASYKKREQVQAVDSKIRAFIALHTIVKGKLGGVAIVDEEDNLIGGLSTTYVRGLEVGNFHLLLKPVTTFMDVVRPENKAFKLSCLPTLPLSKAIEILAWRKEHRIWAETKDGKLDGLLTLTDIIKHITYSIS